MLVNNSSGVLVTPGLDASIEEGKKLFDLNFWAPMAMLQAFTPLLVEAQGCVVNNTSASAYATFGFMSKLRARHVFSVNLSSRLGIYSSSKAVLVAASET